MILLVYQKSPTILFSQAASQTPESPINLGMKLPFGMSAKNPLLSAMSTNNLPALRSLLEDQDRQLFSQIAKNGSPEIAAYLLSRHPIPEDYSQETLSSNPTLNPTQYLAHESARNGNAALFRYLINQYPSLLSTSNRSVERLLVNAMDGGVGIWETILEHNPRWKDHEFSRHQGCVLEWTVIFKKKRSSLSSYSKKGRIRIGREIRCWSWPG